MSDFESNNMDLSDDEKGNLDEKSTCGEDMEESSEDSKMKEKSECTTDTTETQSESNRVHKTPQKRKADLNDEKDLKRKKSEKIQGETIKSEYVAPTYSKLESRQVKDEENKIAVVTQSTSHETSNIIQHKSLLRTQSTQSCDIKISEKVSVIKTWKVPEYARKGISSTKQFHQIMSEVPHNLQTNLDLDTRRKESQGLLPDALKCPDAESVVLDKSEGIKGAHPSAYLPCTQTDPADPCQPEEVDLENSITFRKPSSPDDDYPNFSNLWKQLNENVTEITFTTGKNEADSGEIKVEVDPYFYYEDQLKENEKFLKNFGAVAVGVVTPSLKDILGRDKPTDSVEQPSSDVIPGASDMGQEESDIFKCFPGMASHLVKIKKDARYQKKFYKQGKTIWLPKYFDDLIQDGLRELETISGKQTLSEEGRSRETVRIQEVIQSLVDFYKSENMEELRFKTQLCEKFEAISFDGPPPLVKIQKPSKSGNKDYTKSSYMENSPPSDHSRGNSTSDAQITENRHTELTGSLIRRLSPSASQPQPSSKRDSNATEASLVSSHKPTMVPGTPAKSNINTRPVFPETGKQFVPHEKYAPTRENSPVGEKEQSDCAIDESGKIRFDYITETKVVAKFLGREEYRERINWSKSIIFCRDMLYEHTEEAELQKKPILLKPLFKIVTVLSQPTESISVEEFLQTLRSSQQLYYEMFYNDDPAFYSIETKLTVIKIPLQCFESKGSFYEVADTLNPVPFSSELDLSELGISAAKAWDISEEKFTTDMLNIPTEVLLLRSDDVSLTRESRDPSEFSRTFAGTMNECSPIQEPLSKLQSDLTISDIQFDKFWVPKIKRMSKLSIKPYSNILPQESHKVEMKVEMRQKSQAPETESLTISTSLALVGNKSDAEDQLGTLNLIPMDSDKTSSKSELLEMSQNKQSVFTESLHEIQEPSSDKAKDTKKETLSSSEKDVNKYIKRDTNPLLVVETEHKEIIVESQNLRGRKVELYVSNKMSELSESEEECRLGSVEQHLMNPNTTDIFKPTDEVELNTEIKKTDSSALTKIPVINLAKMDNAESQPKKSYSLSMKDVPELEENQPPCSSDSSTICEKKSLDTKSLPFYKDVIELSPDSLDSGEDVESSPKPSEDESKNTE